MSIRGGFMTRMQSREEAYNLANLPSQAVKLLLPYLTNYAKEISIALVTTLLATAIALALPYLVKIAIDEYIASNNLSGLAIISAGYIILVGFRWLFVYWQGYLSAQVGQKIVHRMREDLFNKIIHQSFKFFEQERVGQVTARIIHDINAIASFITDGAINLIADLVIVVGIIAIMAIINWQLTLITLLSLPAALLSMRYLGKKMRQAYWDVQQALADVNTGVEQGLAGIRVAKSLSRESFTMERFEQLSLQNMKANLKTSILFAAVFPTMTFTNMLGIALILGFGGSQIITGQLTVGILMAFLAYIYRLFGPLRELGLVYGSIQAAGASLDRVAAYMNQSLEIVDTTAPLEPEGGFSGQLEVKDISFSYEQEEVLHKISFRIDPGQSTAIVGPTGAGKSTLAKLIARLYDVNQGAILIDGIDIRQISNRKLRQIVIIVPQDVFLFADTIYENIRYGNPQADEFEIKEAAVQAQAHAFINQLPQGYQTLVGELGVKLSGGQKQLIAFARALLADPKILILDEATANVDPLTETLIQRAIYDIAENRTTLIIAHRFSTLNMADKILVLDHGELTGYNTHHYLIENNPTYQTLYQQYRIRNNEQIQR